MDYVFRRDHDFCIMNELRGKAAEFELAYKDAYKAYKDRQWI